MTELSLAGGRAGTRQLVKALGSTPITMRKGLLERWFAAAFAGLVYPLIWEDPLVDMEALEIGPDDHVVTIASGGCNVLSYLVADPARVTAVDLNPAHVALTRLKLCAARTLSCHGDFHRLFAVAESRLNCDLYDLLLEPRLDAETRAYWSGRGLGGRRRIERFATGFYRHGLLGRFIGLAHAVARLHGVDPRDIVGATTLADQRRFFDERLAPLFDRRLVRLLTSSPVSLYGLGIPPAQYDELAEGRHMADVLRQRLERLACGFALRENGFAAQAFTRSFGTDEAQLPPYLQARHWPAMRARADRVGVVAGSMTDVLDAAPPASVSRFVLLDAQDWMNAGQMNALWRAMTRAAAPGARLIYRTAATTDTVAPRLDAGVRAAWTREPDISRDLTARDRSAIYGAFHLYRLKP